MRPMKFASVSGTVATEEAVDETAEEAEEEAEEDESGGATVDAWVTLAST